MKKTTPAETTQARDDQSSGNVPVDAPAAGEASVATDEQALVPVTAPQDDQASHTVDEPALPNPSAGGCYVRLENGQLQREDD